MEFARSLCSHLTICSHQEVSLSRRDGVVNIRSSASDQPQPLSGHMWAGQLTSLDRDVRAEVCWMPTLRPTKPPRTLFPLLTPFLCQDNPRLHSQFSILSERMLSKAFLRHLAAGGVGGPGWIPPLP